MFFNKSKQQFLPSSLSLFIFHVISGVLGSSFCVCFSSTTAQVNKKWRHALSIKFFQVRKDGDELKRGIIRCTHSDYKQLRNKSVTRTDVHHMDWALNIKKKKKNKKEQNKLSSSCSFCLILDVGIIIYCIRTRSKQIDNKRLPIQSQLSNFIELVKQISKRQF